MRKAALNASTASDSRPKYLEIRLARSSPASRLTRMPAPTEVAATWRSGPGQPFGRVRRLPGEPRNHDRVLLQVLFLDALVEIDIRVVHADVVILVFLDGIESGDAHGAEAEVIGVADPRDDVLAHSEILQRREPLVEDGLRRLAVLHVPAVNRSAGRIEIQVCHELVALVLVRVS